MPHTKSITNRNVIEKTLFMVDRLNADVVKRIRHPKKHAITAKARPPVTGNFHVIKSGSTPSNVRVSNRPATVTSPVKIPKNIDKILDFLQTSVTHHRRE
jgi:hypothetical protein